MSKSTTDDSAFVKRADLSFKDLEKVKKCDLIDFAKYLDVAQDIKKSEILYFVASHMGLKKEAKNSD